LFGLPTVFSLEALDATSRIHQLLFASEERMAVGADFDVQFFFGGTRRPGVAASAGHTAFVVIRMDSFFHATFSFAKNDQIIALRQPHVGKDQKKDADSKAQK
jgi:hypothetical protein